jgi:hypothetical protein
MKTSTSNGKRTGHHKTAQVMKFRGCSLSLDHKTLPVGLEFGEPDLFAGGKAVLMSMTIEEAERVHRALGEMIELRKRQAAWRGATP